MDKMSNDKASEKGLVLMGVLFDIALITQGTTSQPLASATLAASDYIAALKEGFLFKKIEAFFKPTKQLDPIQLDDFYNTLTYDKKTFIDERLVQIERMDNEQKCSILGQLLTKCVQNKMDIETYYRLSTIVERSYIDDLYYFREEFGVPYFIDKDIKVTVELWHKHADTLEIFTKKVDKETKCNNLMSIGLVKEKRITEIDETKAQFNGGKAEYKNTVEWKLTPLGKLFILNAFEFDADRQRP